MNALYYREIYKLGKNHMQPPREKQVFRFSAELSPVFHLPIPDQALYGYELELQTSFTAGIHRIMLFLIKNEFTHGPGLSSLSHVHNVYATWRHKNRLTGNYLLR